MARQDGRIEAGQPLNGAISARAWNRALDAADIVMGDRLSLTAGPQQYSSAPYTWVYGWNETGAAITRWSAFEIHDIYIPPNDNTEGAGYGTDPNAAQFESMPSVVLRAPTSLSPTGNRTRCWCVALEPIPSLALGRVAVAGVVQAKIKVTNAYFRFVDPRNGVLETAEQGYARILWKEPGEGTNRWALLQLGCSEDNVLTASFSGTWNFNDEKTLTLTQETIAGQFTETVQVINGVMPVEAGANGGKCILYRRAWNYKNPTLIAFVLSSLKGYDGSNPVLKKHGGQVQWKTPQLSVSKDGGGTVTDVSLQWT